MSDFQCDLLLESFFFCMVLLKFARLPFPRKMLWNFLAAPTSQAILAVAFHRYFSTYVR